MFEEELAVAICDDDYTQAQFACDWSAFLREAFAFEAAHESVDTLL